MPDVERLIWNADILFDSNVICANDDLAEEQLLKLSKLLMEGDADSDIWFSLISLCELIGSSDAATQVELLKRFQNLYRRFDGRVKFFGTDFTSVRDEWRGDGLSSYLSASEIDDEVSASIAAGSLVGRLKAIRDDWKKRKSDLIDLWSAKIAKCRSRYESDPAFRKEFGENIERFGTEDALRQCEDIVERLIVNVAMRSANDLSLAKANPSAYQCTWTYALLARLADYSATLTGEERNAKFARYGRLLKSHSNDIIDARIISDGAKCGTLITNDQGLFEKVNALHDVHPSLVRIQGFRVESALKSYEPPNGRK